MSVVGISCSMDTSVKSSGISLGSSLCCSAAPGSPLGSSSLGLDGSSLGLGASSLRLGASSVGLGISSLGLDGSSLGFISLG